MATGSLSQHDLSSSTEVGQITEVLHSNCRRWKLLDLLLTISQTALLGLMLLWSAFAIDHWAYLIIQDGSLGTPGRWFYFLFLIIIFPPLSVYLIVRSLKGRINPLFVAQQIEELSPEIKNSISNFWQIRSSRHVHPSIAKSMARRACLDLEEDRSDDGVDSAKTSVWGYSSLGCLAVTAIYFAVMPTPTLQTLHRILIPWDDVQRPSEIRVESVQPGDATITYGATLEVSAELSGADEETPVSLVTESVDGSTGISRFPMQWKQHSYTHLLEESPHGLQRDFHYWIEAGDPDGRMAMSPKFHVTVKPAPSIQVTQVEYTYPTYTKLPRAVNAKQFHVEALEGTTIKVSALANAEIDTAWVQLQTSQGNFEKRLMSVNQQQCDVEFELRVDSNQKPVYVGYQLYFKSKAGESSQHAIPYSIVTLADLPPVIEFTQPEPQQLRRGPVELPANQSIQLAWSAHDPDFDLSSVSMVVSRQNHDDSRTELKGQQDAGNNQRNFTTNFTPARHDLKPGTRVTIFGEAADNRKTSSNPDPNRTQSELLVLHISDPVESTDDKSAASDDMSDNSETPNDPENMDDNSAGSDNNDGMSPNKGNGDNSEDGMTGGASEKPEEGADPDMENGGSGGQGEAADDPDNKTGDNTPANQGGDPSDSNDGNSEETSGDEDSNSADGMASGNSGTGEATENNSADTSGDNTGQPQNNNDDKQGPQPNDGSVEGNPTGEQGDDNNPDNKPLNDGSSKPDDQHDGDIFEKLLDRLRDQQAGNQQKNEQPTQPDPMTGSDNRENSQGTQEGSPNSPQQQPTTGEEDGQANTQNESGKPKTGDPANPSQQNDDIMANPDTKGTETKDPMKDPRAGNGVNQGEQVDDQGGNDSPGQTDGNQTGNSGSGEAGNANGTNSTETPGTEEGTGSPSNVESSGGSQANPQPGTGQQDAKTTDELGLPEEIDDTEQARLDYARRATDLALKYLRDHQDNPSDQLLEDLGITAEQLREMVSRYEQLKQDSSQPGKRSLDDTLKSLGLRPPTNLQPRQAKANQADVKGVSGGGALLGLPAHLQQRFKSFRTGTTVSNE